MEKDNSKYYTPSIEEFHVGFEYELNTQSPQNYKDGYGWVKTSIRTDNWRTNMDIVSSGKVDGERIRVKYLDRIDLESLDYEMVSEHKFDYDQQDPEFTLLDKYEQHYLDNDGNEIFFTSAQFNDPPRIWLNGIEYEIKNKSQLKLILQWTGILKS